MNLEHILTWAALVAASSYALWRGAPPERIGVAVLAVGWLLTPLAEHRHSWMDPQLAMFAVDITVLVALILLAAITHRLWPICASAMQLIAVIQYPLFWAWPHQLYRAFYYSNFSLGYLILGCLIGGSIVEAKRGRALEEPS